MIQAKIIADSTNEFYGFIYKTINIITGKLYIGKRKIKNTNNDIIYLGSGTILRNSIKKYGVINFSREILDYCNDEQELCKKEEEYIIKYNSLYPNGYNIAKRAGGGDLMAGHPNREEINKRRLDSIRSFNRSDDWRKMIGDFSRGKKKNKEVIDKMKETKKNNPYIHNEERRKKMSDFRKGKVSSEETRQKMSEAKKGIPKSKEHNQKISKSLLGRVHSVERVLKIKESLKLVPRKTCVYCSKSFNPGNYQKHINKQTCNQSMQK